MRSGFIFETGSFCNFCKKVKLLNIWRSSSSPKNTQKPTKITGSICGRHGEWCFLDNQQSSNFDKCCQLHKRSIVLILGFFDYIKSMWDHEALVEMVRRSNRQSQKFGKSEEKMIKLIEGHFLRRVHQQFRAQSLQYSLSLLKITIIILILWLWEKVLRNF